jgi:hypothetical protein
VGAPADECVALSAAALAVALGGCGEVSLANAWALLPKIWSSRERARSSDDGAALRRIDTGVELERDIGVTLNARGVGDWSARVRRRYGPGIDVVPRPTGFPQSFLGVVQTSKMYATSSTDRTPQALNAVALVVLTKSSPTARWRVALETGGTGAMSQLPHWHQAFNASSDPHPGYSPTAPAPSWIGPSTAMSDLARLYEHYANHGTPPAGSRFRSGPWTTGQGRRLSSDVHTGQTVLNGQVNPQGFRQTVSYYVDRADPTYQFDFGGIDLTCGTVRGVTRSNPVGGYLLQTPDRRNWGGWLAPGAYASITTSLFHQVCMEIPATSSGEIRMVSGDDPVSEWKVTGVRFIPTSNT